MTGKARGCIACLLNVNTGPSEHHEGQCLLFRQKARLWKHGWIICWNHNEDEDEDEDEDGDEDEDEDEEGEEDAEEEDEDEDEDDNDV